MLACGPCSLKPSEGKLLLPAPSTDFGLLISHHFQQIQARLALDIEKVVNEREHRLHDQIVVLRQENDGLRARLRLPPASPSDSSMQPMPMPADLLSWSSVAPSRTEPLGVPEANARLVPEARPFLLPIPASGQPQDTIPLFPQQTPGRRLMEGDTGQSQQFGGNWRSRLQSAKDLSAALRILADEQERAGPRTLADEQETASKSQQPLQGNLSQNAPIRQSSQGHLFQNAPIRQPSQGRLSQDGIIRRPSSPMHHKHIAPIDVEFGNVEGIANIEGDAKDTELAFVENGAEIFDSVNTEAPSVFATMGSDRNPLDDYKQFELWPIWLVENKSFADKIGERLEGSGSGRKSQEFSDAIARNPTEAVIVKGWAIRPTSAFGLFWNIAFCVVLCYELIVFPMRVFDLDEKGFLEIAGWSCCIFWTIDFILSFFLGYFTPLGTLELHLAKTATNYLKSWCLPDVVVIVIDWISLLKVGQGDGDSNNASIMRAGKVLRTIRVLRILRVLRLRKLKEACVQLDDRINSQYVSIVKSILVNMLFILAVSHFIGCLWFWIGTQPPDGWRSWSMNEKHIDEWGYAYLLSLHWAIANYTPGSMHVQPRNILERAYAVCVLIVGMMLFSSIVSSITAATRSLGSINAHYNHQVWKLRKFFREQKIPIEVTTRVLRYSEFVIKPREQQVSMKDCQILSNIPTSLFMDVMLEIYSKHLEAHILFKALRTKSRRVMQAVCCSAVQDLYLARQDELFGPGQTAHSMYFLIKGRLSYIIRPSGLEFHIHDHDETRWFCEAVLWTPWVHQGNMIAMKECDLLSVNEGTFGKELSKHRADLKMPKKYGVMFVENMNDLAGFNDDDPDNDQQLSDILSPPQKGIDYLKEQMKSKGGTASELVGAMSPS